MASSLPLWPEASIAEIAAARPGSIAIGPFGSRMKSDTYEPSGVPVIRGNNLGPTNTLVGDFVFVSPEFASTLGNANVFSGDLVFPHRGNIGEVGIVPEGHYLLSTSLMKLTLDQKKAYPHFLFYFFKSGQGRHELLKNASQVGTPGIATPLASLRGIRLRLPPLPEQKAIAHILGTLDDKIELNRRMNHTLEAIAQALFKRWFIDPADSGIPKGWTNYRIDELCQINSWTLNRNDNLARIDYIEISEVSRGNIATIQSYARGQEPSRARRRLRHGDTALSTVRPERGAYFLCLNPEPQLIASTGFAILTPTNAPWSLIHAAMTQPQIFEFLGQQADGGAYPAIRPDIIAKINLALPTKRESLDSFHSVCGPLYELAEANRRQSRTLAQLRDTLLPKLLSGELRVPAHLVQAGIKDAKKFLEANA